MHDDSFDSTAAHEAAKGRGFEAMEPIADFSAYIGPYFQKQAPDGTMIRAFLADPRHANLAGAVHGGALMSFADVVLSRALVDLTGFSVRPVTMSLNCNFLAPARIGQWITGTAQVTRRTRSVAFISGLISADDEPVMSATGVWKLRQHATSD